MRSSTCDPAGIRTQDPYIKSVLLYQLSYQILFTPASGETRCKSSYLCPAMQTAIYFLLGFWLLVAPVFGQQTAPSLKQADSLFAAGQETDAALLYELAIANGQPATDAMLLKLAYVTEQERDIPRLLYYLQVYFDRHPTEAVLRKMNAVARTNNLTGYETDDLNYFLLSYKQYGFYVQLLLLLLALYIVGVAFLKSLRHEAIPQRHKVVTLLYVLALLIFVNLPEGYQSGVTNQDRVFLREQPSAAAPIVDVMGRGHKVNILGRTDIYLRVYWRNHLYFVRKDNVWVI